MKGFLYGVPKKEDKSFPNMRTRAITQCCRFGWWGGPWIDVHRPNFGLLGPSLFQCEPAEPGSMQLSEKEAEGVSSSQCICIF